nr:hypothetical protein CFP56_30018 [Quercus suber]
MSSTLSSIERGTKATVDALNAWDYDALVAVRADDFIFQGLPASLGLPAMSNTEYQGLFANVLTPAFKDFKISATTAVGQRTWDLIQMMSFNETGEKLIRLDEFFDSKVYLEMMQAMQESGAHVAH